MTKKLYYDDAYQTNFNTKGIKQEKDEQGNWYVVLEDTLFYPTGGGQPHDTGHLNGTAVYNVDEIDGEIRHYIEEKLPSIDHIEGEINWERRFDHMQQHLGQHILTAAFVQVAEAETVSFHLGKEVCTIDLNVEELHKDIIEKAETVANQMVLENHPVLTKWVTKEEAVQYPLRKHLSVEENIRLVIIPDYDYNGCGGTHPSSTGEVTGIKILGWEREKKKLRVQFICGKRILQQFADKHEVTEKLTQLLSAKQENLVDAVSQLQQANKKLTKELSELQQQIIEYEAENLYQHKVEINGEKVVKQVFAGKTMQDMQKIMRILAEKDSSIFVFLVSENEDKLQFVCARPKHLSINMKEVAAHILPLINGKGGGSPMIIQGGGEKKLESSQLLEKLVEACQDMKISHQ